MTAQNDALARLKAARSSTDTLFSHLNVAAIYDRPIAERHRMIFYLGHLEAFDWNQLKQVELVDQSPNPEFDHLFAFGIDPEPGKLPHDTPGDWPSLAEVNAYNAAVRSKIDQKLANAPGWMASMLIEHRHMHAETFAYILHSLEAEKKMGPSEHLPAEVPFAKELVSVPAGEVTLGKPEAASFGWDNEHPETKQFVSQFAMTRHKITNGEWLDFMRETGAAAPYYWFERDGQYFYRGMFQSIPLPLSWPVYATWQQAAAYARHRNLALPTEAQFHRAAYGTAQEGRERAQPWEASTFRPELAANFDYTRWDPVPVNASPESDSHWGISQLVGNGWEWTSSLFTPFPGFAPHPAYPGYSANFFDGEHYVLKGASPRTSSTLVRRSFRNWFRPEYPYVYATFHLVQN